MHIIFPLTALSLDTVYATENFVDENVLKKKSMIIALYKEMKATSPKSFQRADLNNL